MVPSPWIGVRDRIERRAERVVDDVVGVEPWCERQVTRTRSPARRRIFLATEHALLAPRSPQREDRGEARRSARGRKAPAMTYALRTSSSAHTRARSALQIRISLRVMLDPTRLSSSRIGSLMVLFVAACGGSSQTGTPAQAPAAEAEPPSRGGDDRRRRSLAATPKRSTPRFSAPAPRPRRSRPAPRPGHDYSALVKIETLDEACTSSSTRPTTRSRCSGPT